MDAGDKSRLKECIACSEIILSAAKLCKHCKTLQNDSRFLALEPDSSLEPAQRRCLACSVEVEPNIRICEICDATLNAPKECPSCLSSIQSAKLKNGVRSAIAGRIRSCSSCGYYFFLPIELAGVLKTLDPQPLGRIDLEYLFFAAWSYQSGFGGGRPMVDCDYEFASEIYEKWMAGDGEGDFRDSWLGSDFPGFQHDALSALLVKYQLAPQLFGQSIEFDDEEGWFELELESYLEVPELQEPRVRVALQRSLEISNSESDGPLIQTIQNLLASENYFW